VALLDGLQDREKKLKAVTGLGFYACFFTPYIVMLTLQLNSGQSFIIEEGLRNSLGSISTGEALPDGLHDFGDMLSDVSEDSVRSAPDFWDWATRVVPAVYTNVKYNQAAALVREELPRRLQLRHRWYGHDPGAWAAAEQHLVLHEVRQVLPDLLHRHRRQSTLIADGDGEPNLDPLLSAAQVLLGPGFTDLSEWSPSGAASPITPRSNRSAGRRLARTTPPR